MKVKLVKVSHIELPKVCRMFMGNVDTALHSVVKNCFCLWSIVAENSKSVRCKFEMSDFKIHV
jgi:hypothetical protein